MTLPFGTVSQSKLLTAHPDLQKLFNRVNERRQCSIFTGSRSKEEQIKAVNAGLSKTLNSKHLIQPDGYSHAVDAGPDPVNWDVAGYKLDCIYFAGYVMAVADEMYKAGEITHKIRYGGDFNQDTVIRTESFQDTDHFEII